MLPELTDFKDSVTLVSNTGIQFLDFGIKTEVREPSGNFALLGSSQITLLAEDDNGFFYSTDNSGSQSSKANAQPKYELGLQDSLNLLNGLWLPLLFFAIAAHVMMRAQITGHASAL